MEHIPSTAVEYRNDEPDVKAEGYWVLGYFAVYLGYLFLRLENEFFHWFSLVVVPFTVVLFSRRMRTKLWDRSSAFHSVGLRKGNLTNGLVWAIVIGIALSTLQLVLSRNSGEIIKLFVSGKALLLFPLSFLLIFCLAGFTEEFFFRGVMQTRLQQLFGSKVLAVVLTSLLFGLYHLPYAYLNPQWPSYGNWPEAFGAAFGQGVPLGLILGTVYARTNSNLFACVVLHALVNSLPGMVWIKIG